MSINVNGRYRPKGKILLQFPKAAIPPVVVPPLAFTQSPTMSGARIGDQFTVNWATNRTPDRVDYTWLNNDATARFSQNKNTYWPWYTSENFRCRVTATLGQESISALTNTKIVLGDAGNLAFQDGFEGTGIWRVNRGDPEIVTGPSVVLESSRMLQMNTVSSGNPSDYETYFFNARSGGNRYRARIWARAVNGTSRMRVLVFSLSTFVLNDAVDLTTEWRPYDFYFNTNGSMILRIASPDINTPVFWVDRASVFQIV